MPNFSLQLCIAFDNSDVIVNSSPAGEARGAFMKVALIAIGIASLAAITTGCAEKSTPDPAVQAQAAQLFSMYGDCVKQSIQTQAKSTSDRSLAMEIAFIACSTEERNLFEYINYRRDPSTAQQLISKFKMGLCTEVLGKSVWGRLC
jgi:hypothetical protein